MATAQFDVVVVGAGPAGYVAAIRCTQLGLRTACVDRWVGKDGKPALGGTCLNVGCIPSKALLESSEHFVMAQSGLAEHGVTLGEVGLDVEKMIARKDKVVKELTSGIEMLFKANKVTWFRGSGRLLENKRIEVISHEDPDNPDLIEAEHVILATGSTPIDIGAAPVDGDRIVDSSGALEFTDVPKKLGVIGAGVIGLEMGSVWNRLGSEVVLLEAQDTFLPPVDEQCSRDAKRQFEKQGLDIRLSCRVTATKVTAKGVTVHYKDHSGDQTLHVDKLVVAVGRRPQTDKLVAPEVGIGFDERGYIHVDEQCRTSVPGVYAIGDCVRGPMLAHKGSEEGVMVAELIAGQHSEVSYHTIPWVIYTDPEIAWVGQTEQELKAAGTPYSAGVFPFAANGRARAMDQTAGLVKILAHQETDRILGVHIVGPAASELIAEAVLAMEYAASSEDIARTIHAHPTLSEAFHEAALSVSKRALHRAN